MHPHPTLVEALKDIRDGDAPREKKICGDGGEEDGWEEHEKCSADGECGEGEGDEETNKEAGDE